MKNIFLIILFLLPRTILANCKEIQFDFEGYGNERKIIMDLEGINEFKFGTTQIGIAHYDLNLDGENELISKICNNAMFGSNECIIGIYTMDNNNYKYIGPGTNFDLCISDTKTNGYFDIFSTVKNTDPEVVFGNVNDRLEIWKFAYDGIVYIHIK